MTQLRALCAHLQPLLDTELAAGNSVKDRGPSPAGRGGTLVLLTRPFVAPPSSCPASLRFTAVNDPHWWLAEYGCREHADILACAFP